MSSLAPSAPYRNPLIGIALKAGALRIDFEPGDVLFLNNHHAVLGLTRRRGSAAPATVGTFRSGGALMRLSLESGLVMAHSRPVQSPQAPCTATDDAASQAAA